MIDLQALPIDAAELQARIDQLGSIGTHPEGGLYRALYDDGWVAAMALIRTWLDQLGMTTRFDAVGNLWGRLNGSAGGDAIVTGSHVDTVRQGGKYDGALGIHVAITAVKALVAAHGAPTRPIEILVVCEEEGSRFNCNFWGARAITGRIGPDEPERVVDPSGVTIGGAMRERGFDPSRVKDAERHDVAAFLECHIEQGAILEREGYPLGVVSTITGSHWMRVRVGGRQDHAGTTPMDLRRDPVAGAAQMIERVIATATRMGRPAVATVGRITANPGAVNVVPGWCEFTIDTRHSEPEPRRELLAEIQTILKDVARERDLKLDVQPIADHDPVPMSAEIRMVLEDVIKELEVRYLVMPSGAGHDSEILAPRFPTAMLFVPSRDGRSHTPAEYTPVEQIVPGVQVIAGALHRLAY